MNAIDLKRCEFRHYLETCGVMDALSYALIKLYDETEKPADPVAFVRQHFKRPNDDADVSKRPEDMDASELIQRQSHELNMARQEIAKLRDTLNSMSSNSPNAREIPNSYRDIADDSKYDNTLLKKYLTDDLLERLKLLGEPSIIDCITRAKNASGVVALDADCYNRFSDLFEPIIKDIHCVAELNNCPDSDWGDASTFESFEKDTVLSIEMNCFRSLANIPFIPGITAAHLEYVLSTVQNAIQSGRTDDNDIDGEFYKISDVKENERIFSELQQNSVGFRSMKPQEHVLWPVGRGLFVNCSRTQSLLINEKEHLCFISKEMGADFGAVYKHLMEFIEKFGNGLSFGRSDKFGWLTADLGTLGSGLCCKVQLKLTQPVVRIEEICQRFKIKITPVSKEDGYVVELTSGRCFGLSEFECAKLFYENVTEIIDMLKNSVECEENYGSVSHEINRDGENSEEPKKIKGTKASKGEEGTEAPKGDEEMTTGKEETETPNDEANKEELNEEETVAKPNEDGELDKPNGEENDENSPNNDVDEKTLDANNLNAEENEEKLPFEENPAENAESDNNLAVGETAPDNDETNQKETETTVLETTEPPNDAENPEDAEEQATEG